MTGLPAVPSYTTFVTRIQPRIKHGARSRTLGGHDSPEHRCSAYSLCIKEDDESETDRQTLKDPS
ncbi:Hypothetical protein FKW44_003344 [Caligus rogercresseyi]|uniref:Uncharacterized protein n=1 Tax=Caligus rogercresseyi TaxID=217165 RepID=A0A7T8QWV7_CALRO|nr:Hypothetical protein FKW44_003344 [Caligus rogercresseyi]